MYEYYWGHTKAQVELMTIDGVYTCYKKDDKKKGDHKEPPSPEKMEETVRKWEENKKKRKFKLEDFIGKKEEKTSTDTSDNKNE